MDPQLTTLLDDLYARRARAVAREPWPPPLLERNLRKHGRRAFAKIREVHRTHYSETIGVTTANFACPGVRGWRGG